jgi:DNA-binding NarL/FixJ family response regulator
MVHWRRFGLILQSMKVLIADDQAGVRSALRLLMEEQSSDCIISEVADSESVFSVVENSCPDIVLLDAELPGFSLERKHKSDQNLQEVIGRLRTLCPDLKVIVLTSRGDLRSFAKICEADILISKAEPPETLLTAIRSLCVNL